MGLLGDLSKLRKQSKELDKNWDAGAQARGMLDQMKAMNESMERSTTALAEGVPASAQVLLVGQTVGTMNMDPILPVELLVTQEGAVPHPVSLQLTVPMAQLYRVQPGATLPVRVSPSDPSIVAVDWMAPPT